jgi:hypothetical protein
LSDNCSIAHTSAHGVRRRPPSERHSRRWPTASRKRPPITWPISFRRRSASRSAGIVERFGVDDFIERVAAREKVKVSIAAFHARVVLSLLAEVVSYGIMLKVRRELPEEFGTLFLPERGAGTEQPHATHA